jgi:hypothetical protein
MQRRWAHSRRPGRRNCCTQAIALKTLRFAHTEARLASLLYRKRERGEEHFAVGIHQPVNAGEGWIALMHSLQQVQLGQLAQSVIGEVTAVRRGNDFGDAVAATGIVHGEGLD